MPSALHFEFIIIYLFILNSQWFSWF